MPVVANILYCKCNYTNDGQIEVENLRQLKINYLSPDGVESKTSLLRYYLAEYIFLTRNRGVYFLINTNMIALVKILLLSFSTKELNVWVDIIDNIADLY